MENSFQRGQQAIRRWVCLIPVKSKKMNYRDLNNHNITALLHHCDPIVRQLWLAIATFGFLSLVPGLGLNVVFESGIMEFIAALSLPFSLSLAILFCGLTIAASNEGWIFGFIQRCCSYWAGISVSLSAATLGVVAGLFLPFWWANGLPSALMFLSIGLIAGISYGLLAHFTGVIAFSATLGRLGKYRRWFGVVLMVLGIAISIIATYNQWLKLNDF